MIAEKTTLSSALINELLPLCSIIYTNVLYIVNSVNSPKISGGGGVLQLVSPTPNIGEDVCPLLGLTPMLRIVRQLTLVIGWNLLVNSLYVIDEHMNLIIR